MSYRLPIIPEPKIMKGDEFDKTSVMEYDEIMFDPRTNRYLTLFQQKEINNLKKELEEKKKACDKSIKSIIGYFYKERQT